MRLSYLLLAAATVLLATLFFSGKSQAEWVATRVCQNGHCHTQWTWQGRPVVASRIVQRPVYQTVVPMTTTSSVVTTGPVVYYTPAPVYRFGRPVFRRF
jgi:hypothetical protein